MRLSVIIVNWNVRELLRQCLTSIRRETKGVEYEVVVVDNASGDGSAAMVARDFPWVKLVASNRNLGFAAGNNEGLRLATGDLVLLLNPDTELKDDALTRLVEFMNEQPHVAICGPQLLNADGTLQPSVRRFPKFVDQALIALKLHRLWPKLRALRRYQADDFDYATAQPCDQVMGAALLIRRSVVDEIGLLDERFFIWFEEVDWCRRAVDAGFQIWYAPVGSITHHGGESFGQVLGPQKQRWFNASMRRYFQKHQGWLPWLGLCLLQPLSLALAYVVQGRRVQPTRGALSAKETAAAGPSDGLSGLWRTFMWALAGFWLLEIISFWGYSTPIVNAIGFMTVAALVCGLAVWRFEWALLLLLAELLVGSQGGYLLYFGEASGLQFSLRMLLWLVVMSVWAARSLIAWRRGGSGLEWLDDLQRRRLLWPYVMLLAVFGFAAINGVLRGNGLANVFFDANGYAYFALLPACLQGLRTPRVWRRLVGLGLAAVTVGTIKALLVLYVFSHRLFDVAAPTYTWVRDARVGEITRMVGDYYRVFFQSQLFGLVTLLLAVPTFLAGQGWHDRRAAWCGYGVVIAATALLLSLSRSFWFGLFVAGCGLLGWLVWTRATRRVWGRLVTLATMALLCGSLLIWISYALPWPQKGASISFAALIGGRATSLTGEAAANSRWALLPILNAAALEHPLLGSGFGRTVTYVTSDPRLLADIPTGEYVTFAFEWGYQDLWLKLGLLGLLAYSWFLWRLARPWMTLARRRTVWKMETKERLSTLVAVGVLAVLTALLATNVFSPYLNHPLGIGLLMVVAATATTSRQKDES